MVGASKGLRADWSYLRQWEAEGMLPAWTGRVWVQGVLGWPCQGELTEEGVVPKTRKGGSGSSQIVRAGVANDMPSCGGGEGRAAGRGLNPRQKRGIPKHFLLILLVSWKECE